MTNSMYMCRCKISEVEVTIGENVTKEFMKEFKEALMKKLEVVIGDEDPQSE